MAKQPLSDVEKARRAKERLTAKFEKAALGTSQIYARSLGDVRGAYENKKESLTALFDAAKTAKSDRGGWIGWSVVWAIFIPPIAIYTVYKAYESHKDFRDLGKELDRELDEYRNGTQEAPAVESTPSAFKTRIKTAAPQ